MAKDEYIIAVNATEYTLENETVTYEQVVKLAYPDAEIGGNNTFAVTFEHAKEPKQGTLAEGGSVQVKKRNTEFDVVPANRA
ncbi:MAG: multiubiquitin domain-containing protein [Anaerolineae bacterium]|nr:multiubiquitin domain-containing protein [Anaerolineae bacterium]